MFLHILWNYNDGIDFVLGLIINTKLGHVLKIVTFVL